MMDLILDILDDLLMVFPSRRRWNRRDEWTGTVEAKKTRPFSKDAYLVVFRTDNGQRKKLRLYRKEDFDLYEEGRRYAKKVGDDLPDTSPKP